MKNPHQIWWRFFVWMKGNYIPQEPYKRRSREGAHDHEGDVSVCQDLRSPRSVWREHSFLLCQQPHRTAQRKQVVPDTRRGDRERATRDRQEAGNTTVCGRVPIYPVEMILETVASCRAEPPPETGGPFCERCGFKYYWRHERCGIQPGSRSPTWTSRLRWAVNGG